MPSAWLSSAIVAGSLFLTNPPLHNPATITLKNDYFAEIEVIGDGISFILSYDIEWGGHIEWKTK